VCTEREQELIDFIRTRVAKNHSVAITPTTPLFRDRLLDSMNILGLIGYVEAHIGRKLAAREIVMANFASVRDVVRGFLE
jgi:acyl carrier protein